MKNSDDLISIPEMVTVPNIERDAAKSTLLDEICQIGFCSPEGCSTCA